MHSETEHNKSWTALNSILSCCTFGPEEAGTFLFRHKQSRHSVTKFTTCPGTGAMALAALVVEHTRSICSFTTQRFVSDPGLYS